MSEIEGAVKYFERTMDSMSKTNELREPIRLAIDALKKQIPISADPHIDTGIDWLRECTSCGAVYQYERVGDILYCPYCGQAWKPIVKAICSEPQHISSGAYYNDQVKD